MIATRWVEMVLIVLSALTLFPTKEISAQEPSAQVQASSPQARDDDWAADYLAQDSLSGKDPLRLEDIRQALLNPSERDTVITRHFSRLNQDNSDDQKAFLVEMLSHQHPAVQRQAAVELSRLGMLEQVIVEKLLSYLESDDADLREVVVIALRTMEIEPSSLPEAYLGALIESLDSETPETLEAARMQLLELGSHAVPKLLASLQDSRPKIRKQSAWLLAEIVGSRRSLLGRDTGEQRDTTRLPRKIMPPIARSMEATVPQVAPPPPKSAATEPGHVTRQADSRPPSMNRVYFGTNRQVAPRDAVPWSRLTFFPVISVLAVAGLMVLWRHPRDQKHVSGCSTMVFTGLFCAVAGIAFMDFRQQLIARGKIGEGTKFGPRRDLDTLVHYGYCDVSIPPSHTVGELEAPLLGNEDEAVHVIMKRTVELADEAFFDLVKNEIAKREPKERSCFVFVHGFNVSFEDAARRTAQIHHDLNFPGVPLFFSWPSRASIHHYFSDRNEIEFSRYLIKQFLIDVAERVQADRIHVIAHSMGADATCRAIAELEDRGKVFDQIILAAPDIDRDVFLKQLVPRMTKTANRTTLYCSHNDLALRLSYTFNDVPRAGDSNYGVVVTEQVDTVDASEIDTDLLGHSYYGDCRPLLDDVRKLMESDLAPENRQLKAWPFERELRYWTFPHTERLGVTNTSQIQ